MLIEKYGQQGDVILRKVDKLPDGLREIKPTKKGHILAAGEATGHHHCVTAFMANELLKKNDDYELRMYEEVGEDGKVYMVVTDETPITHEEHEAVTVSPGVWEVTQVREFDPFAEEAERVRRVQD